MPRIRLTRERLIGQRSHPAGDVLDVSERVAQYELASGTAESADGAKPTEQPAVKSPPDTRKLSDVTGNGDKKTPDDDPAPTNAERLVDVTFESLGIEERDIALLNENKIATPADALAHEDLAELPKIGKVTRDRVLKAISDHLAAE